MTRPQHCLTWAIRRRRQLRQQQQRHHSCLRRVGVGGGGDGDVAVAAVVVKWAMVPGLLPVAVDHDRLGTRPMLWRPS